MKNKGKNGSVRRYGSASANVLSRGKSGAISNSRRLRASEVAVTSPSKAHAIVEGHMRSNVFSGPSVGGKNMKYIKVVSGTVEDRKPSFA